MDNYIVALFAVLVGVGDWWTTAKILKAGGQELNPFMRYVMAVFGKQWGSVKLLAHVVFAGAVLLMDNWLYTSIVGVAIFLNALVVAHNVKEMNK